MGERLAWGILGTLAFAVLLVIASGRAEREQTLTLRLAHSLNTSHPVHRAMEVMAAQLTETSKGRVQLRIYPNSQLGSEREMIELVQLGAIDMVKTSTSPLEGFVPAMGLFSVPYVFSDEAAYWRVLEGPLGRDLLLASEPQRLRGLCYYDAGSRSFYTKTRPVRQPTDLEGLKIRVQNSRTAIHMVKAMGGAPTPIAFGELYSALEQGVVDGAENNPPSFLTSRHYEVCRYYTLDEHTRVPDVILISAASWKRLGKAEQGWVQEAADRSAQFQRRLWAEKTQEAVAAAAAAGVEILKPDKAPFQAAVQSLYQDYRGTEIGALIEAVQAIVAEPVE